MGNSLAAPITKDTLAEALRRANESCQTSIVKEWLAKQQRDTI
jgi:hypothetical protein